MRNRSLLHYTKVPNFLEWSQSEGFLVQPTKGLYESFRIQKNKELIIGYKRNTTDHITVYGKGLELIKKFLKSAK